MSPIGTVLSWAGKLVDGDLPDELNAAKLTPSSPPEHKASALWMLCDGRALPDSDWGALYGSLGDSYGAGDYPHAPPSEGTFNLPDLRGCFVRGAGSGHGLTNHLGDRDGYRFQPSGTAQPRGGVFRTDQQGRHQHSYSRTRAVQTSHGSGPKGIYESNADQTSNTSWENAHDHNVIGGDDETRSANVDVHFIIRVRHPTDEVPA